jgi:hypothetical protein
MIYIRGSRKAAIMAFEKWRILAIVHFSIISGI